MPSRILILIASVAALLAATTVLSYAQTPEKQRKESIVSLAAAKLGLTTDQLETALKEARKDLGARPGAVRLGKLVRDELTVAATALGISDVKTLRQELAGSTLTAVAQKRNVAPASVASAIKNDLNAKIDALVTSGKLKPDRATRLKERAATRVDALMVREFKARPTP